MLNVGNLHINHYQTDNQEEMKTRILILSLFLSLVLVAGQAEAQSLRVQPELKELIGLSLQKDRKVVEKDLEKEITELQRMAVRSAYLPKVEMGGKYLYAYSVLDSKIDEIQGFESIAQLQEFMQNPAFPVLFPNLAQLTNELTQLQQLLIQQGVELPKVSKDMSGNLHGNYVGVDASVKMLLYSGGQVPNIAKALAQKIKVQDALSDKAKSEVISDVITCYDQLALLDQTRRVLDESAVRLAAEKKFAIAALNNGMATSFDTLKIAVAEANLQAKQAEYESRKSLLHQKLSQLTGKPVAELAGMHPALEPLVYSGTSNDISNRAEIKALSYGVEAQKYMLKSEKSHYLPKVQAVVSGRYDYIFKADADFNDPIPMDMKIDNLSVGPTVMAGVGFKWEIFDRTSNCKVKQSELEIKKAENAREEARELLELNQTKALTSYQSANTQTGFKEKQLVAAKRALELATQSYNEGVINITERLAAETDMQSAELDYLQSVFAQRQATLDCIKATGDLTVTNIQ